MFKRGKNVHYLKILAICAGAQMIGGLHQMKMHLSVKDETAAAAAHKSKEKQAHEVLIFKNSPLQKIMRTSEQIMTVNSRHNESMAENVLQQYYPQTDMEIYAVSKSDNIPEAWGNQQKNILCIQWHPENLAENSPAMQNIYNWLVEKSAAESENKAKKMVLPLNLLPKQKQR